MPRSNTSDYDEDEQDIVAQYENQESHEDQSSFQRNDDFGSEKEDEENKDEDTSRRIDPPTTKKHVVRNPLPKLNTERLKGPKGIHTIEKYFEGFKFYGKGHEKTDLDRIMKRLEHWGHRLFPKFDFDDFLEKVEKLGTKRDLQVFIHKYRLDMINENEDIILEDNMDAEEEQEQVEPIDEFDLLIAEQIEKQKRVTHQSVSDLSTNSTDAFNKLLSTSNASEVSTASQLTPTILSQSEPTTSQLTDEVKERIERNRQQAIQRKIEKLNKKLEEVKKKKLEEKANAESGETTNLESQVLTTNLQETYEC
ncbi:protein TIPIN homolog [Ceratina calcarata]|uniref:TIMELESS-interacting protein n=1 Tax=Ceratina calcarata TaxID=156304 RepID=A0AAJ7S2C7_9HYME|nr:protein TIPIN homolog [Ceratina calcarata]